MACIIFSGFVAANFLHAEEVKSAEPKAQEVKAPEAPAPAVTGSASLGVYNQYIFRGYEIGQSGLVAQPSLTASYKGFSATFWGNMDTNQRSTRSADFSAESKAFKKGWNETDLTLSYTYAINKLSLTGGYIYYGTKYADETEELFATIAYDIISKPSLPVYKEITLDLGASFGYYIGASDYWRTFDTSTGTYTGTMYKGLHDGMVKVGLTIPATKAFSIQPSIQYWFPLSSNAGKEYETVPNMDIKDSYNPNGPVKNTLVYGVGFTYSF
jgi:hypothetical protein